jgi:ubiquinone/menaquinone biosynthesis C-methylase UbiE
MISLDEAKRRAAATYNAAADYFDHPANSFWDRYGRHTVERLALAPGARILDACCGSGASAIPAAEITGSNGSVTGIDLAESLLELARTKAKQLHLENTEFRTGDITQLPFDNAAFDAVICVFGIFFVPDMEAALRELKRVTRPGGKIAITTWGPRVFEPANTAFWNSVRAIRPDLYKGFNPWDRISDVDSLRELFNAAGLNQVEVVAENGSQTINAPDDWWAMIMGTGYRGTLEQLSPGELERVRAENFEFIQSTGLKFVETNVLYALAHQQISR